MFRTVALALILKFYANVELSWVLRLQDCLVLKEIK